MAIYNAYLEVHADTLSTEDKMIWKVLDHLYGPERFKAGGGLQNTRQVYEIARECQYTALVEEAALLAKKMDTVAQQMKRLLEYEIKPNRI